MAYYLFIGILAMALLTDQTTRCTIKKRWIHYVVEQGFKIKSDILQQCHGVNRGIVVYRCFDQCGTSNLSASSGVPLFIILVITWCIQMIQAQLNTQTNIQLLVHKPVMFNR